MMVCGKGRRGTKEDMNEKNMNENMNDQGIRMHGWIDKDGPTGTDRKRSKDR